ncbi:MAG: hypothetical protein J7621_21415 [Niastella sp.]|nr:hypothetical protein [Niastella sp.]PZR03237.1 MAG: hypothetical protein DI539_26495 [Flavobacterium psychrophilum]
MLTRRLIFIVLLFIIRPLTGFGNDGGMKGFRNLAGIYKMRSVADTIPEVKKPEEESPTPTKPDKKIKEVPKSRRQVKPVPLPTVPVKPIKVIKPKIIKPITGLIGH